MIKDPYQSYMQKAPEDVYNDHPIEDFTLEALSEFMDDGAFTHSFDVTVKGKKECTEVFILSTVAKYESENGEIPAAQVSVIDNNGSFRYYSPVYEIGHKREFYRREWRVPATIDRYDIVRLSFIIPAGVKLSLKDIRI